MRIIQDTLVVLSSVLVSIQHQKNWNSLIPWGFYILKLLLTNYQQLTIFANIIGDFYMPDNVVSNSHILLYLLLKIILESRCCKICERFDILPELQANKSVYQASWMLTEGMRLLVQRQKIVLLLPVIIIAGVCTFSCVHFLSLNSYRATWKESDCNAHGMGWMTEQELWTWETQNSYNWQ